MSAEVDCVICYDKGVIHFTDLAPSKNHKPEPGQRPALTAVAEHLTTPRGMSNGPIELLPVESIALTVALAQTLRGDTADPNTAAMCVLALARLEGRHDWTAEDDA